MERPVSCLISRLILKRDCLMTLNINTKRNISILYILTLRTWLFSSTYYSPFPRFIIQRNISSASSTYVASHKVIKYVYVSCTHVEEQNITQIYQTEIPDKLLSLYIRSDLNLDIESLWYPDNFKIASIAYKVITFRSEYYYSDIETFDLMIKDTTEIWNVNRACRCVKLRCL